MSIDTLLEAARYLEWQAQQQQITREEEKKRENAIVVREAEQLVQQLQQHCMAENGASLLPAAMQVNHLSWGVEAPRLAQQPPHPQQQQQQQQQQHPQHQHQHHIQAVATGATLPITVIPIPMVQANATPHTITTTIAGAAAPTHLSHVAGPMTLATALSPQPTQLLASPVSQPSAVVVTTAAAAGAAAAMTVGKDRQSQSPPHQHQHQRHLVAAVKGETSILPQPTIGSPAAAGSSPKQQQQQQQSPQRPPVTQTHPLPHPHAPPHAQLLQSYPGQILTSPAQHQHALLPQPATLTQSHQAQQLGQVTQRPNGASLEDMRNMDAKRRPGGAGTREVHNKLEKHRRAHLKECFETLKRNVPNVDEKKTSNLSVLRSALRYIQTLKRKEKEFEHEMERLAREKIATQQRLAELKKDLSLSMDALEIDRLLRQTVQPEDDQASTSTASEGEDNFDQDIDGDVPSAPSSGAPANPNPKPPHHHAPSDPRPVTMPPITLLPAQHQHQPPAVHPAPITLPQHITIHSHKLTPVAPAMTVVSPLPTVTVSSSPQPQTVMAAAAAAGAPQAIAPAPPPSQPTATAIPVSTHLVMPQAGQHPHPQQATVIAHASVSHASVIQAVNHVLPVTVAAGHTTKHLAHIAPSGGGVVTAAAAPGGVGGVTAATALPINAVPVPTTVTAMGQPIGHITVAHLSPHLPVNALPMNVNVNGATLYPAQQVAVSQPAVVGHIAHALATHHHHHHHHPHPQHHPHHAGHAHVNGVTPVSMAAAGTQGGAAGATATVMSKGATVVTAHHHPQLVGQTVLNPVTMVTVPQFPVSTLKLA